MPIAIQEGYAAIPGLSDLVPGHRAISRPRSRRSSSCMAGPAPPTTIPTPSSCWPNGGRAVIHYDQLGCGRSTHLRDKGADFWTAAAVPGRAGQPDGASRHRRRPITWSASPGAACSAPSMASPGRRACAPSIIANSPASMELWVQEANRLREALPPEVQATLLRHEKDGTTNSAGIHGRDPGVL